MMWVEKWIKISTENSKQKTTQKKIIFILRIKKVWNFFKIEEITTMTAIGKDYLEFEREFEFNILNEKWIQVIIYLHSLLICLFDAD